MADAMTYEELMEQESVKENIEKAQAVIEADPVAMKLIDAAKTVEDLYEATKRFIQMKLEDFKVVFQNTFAYFSSEKAELSDEILDDVAGGWSLSSVFSSISKKALCIAGCVIGGAICVAGCALGAAIIAATGPIGVIGGGAVAMASMGIGGYMIDKCYSEMNS